MAMLNHSSLVSSDVFKLCPNQNVDFAYERGIIVKGTSSAMEAEASFHKCAKALEKPTESKRILVDSCETALQSILDAGSQVLVDSMFCLRLTWTDINFENQN